MIVQPSHAYAGFFFDLVTKVLGTETQASEQQPINEDVVHNSQNVPLLESSINPDQKNIKDEPLVEETTLLSNNGALGIDSELEKYDPSVKITTYVVKKGDTLEGIAKKLKTPKSTIIDSNADLKKSDLLKVGQSLVIFTIKSDAPRETPKEVEKLAITKKEVPVVKEKPEVKEPEVTVKPNVEVPVVETPEVEAPVTLTTPTPAVEQPAVVEQPQIKVETPVVDVQVSNGQPEGDIDSGYIWPFPKGVGRVSQGLHADQAYDFAAPKGTPIYAVQSGTVLISHASGYNGGYGLYVVINFDDGRQAIFGHMSKVLAKVGQVIKKGDVIGYVGSTGKSTGPHLHLGFHGELRNPYIGLKVNAKDLELND